MSCPSHSRHCIRSIRSLTRLFATLQVVKTFDEYAVKLGDPAGLSEGEKAALFDSMAASLAEYNADCVSKEKAALKMQSMQRGKAARAEVQEKKDEIEQTGVAVKLQSMVRGKAAREEVAGMKEEQEQTEVAVKLQAMQRGKLARAEVQEKKAGAAGEGVGGGVEGGEGEAAVAGGEPAKEAAGVVSEATKAAPMTSD